MKEHSLSRSGLYRILHEKEKFSPAKVLTESPMKGVKSHRRLKHDDLEKKLMQWIIETERRGLLVGGPMIKEKAQSLAAEMDITGLKLLPSYYSPNSGHSPNSGQFPGDQKIHYWERRL